MFLVTVSRSFAWAGKKIMNSKQFQAVSGDVHTLALMSSIPIYIAVLTFSWFSYNISLSCDQQGLSELEAP